MGTAKQKNDKEMYVESLEEQHDLPIASGQEEYIQEVMTKEAKIKALQKERQADEKQMKQIKQSNTWKQTRFFRSLQAFFTRLTGGAKQRRSEERRVGSECRRGG